jgi:hypothetical protein
LPAPPKNNTHIYIAITSDSMILGPNWSVDKRHSATGIVHSSFLIHDGRRGRDHLKRVATRPFACVFNIYGILIQPCPFATQGVTM